MTELKEIENDSSMSNLIEQINPKTAVRWKGIIQPDNKPDLVDMCITVSSTVDYKSF